MLRYASRAVAAGLCASLSLATALTDGGSTDTGEARYAHGLARLQSPRSAPALPPRPVGPVTVVPRGPPPLASSVLDLIGNTPLVELRSLSQATGRRILVKCECFGPGGSVKDRAALSIVRAAEEAGKLDNNALVEATGGNTGIALALIGSILGFKTTLTMPPATSNEKVALSRGLGATVEVCPSVPFDNAAHYYTRAGAIAAATGAFWTNQFENTANAAAHYETTGPEIWAQAEGNVDAIALASGTGGTIGGLTSFLREKNAALKVFLIDPAGSSLASYLTTKTLTPSPGSSISEGVGIGRITENFALADRSGIDGVFDGDDKETVDMAYFLLRKEGLWVGPSAAMNVVAAVKAARLCPPGSTVVTILCDSGARYASKLYDATFLSERGLAVSPSVLRGELPEIK
jgi:cysteine synthase A